MLRKYGPGLKILVLASVLLATGVAPARAEYGAAPVASQAQVGKSTGTSIPEWLEPRGLNIIDMVGWVPDEYLTGAIISYTPGFGILRYESGERRASTIMITAKAYPRYIISGWWSGSIFGCLGQPARIDQLGSVAPAATLRVYLPDGSEVTQELGAYAYVPGGRIRPIRNPQQSEALNQYRYAKIGPVTPRFASDGALILPENMGCEITISYKNYPELTLVFVAQIV